MENTINYTEFLDIQKEMNDYLKTSLSHLKLENKYLHLKKDFLFLDLETSTLLSIVLTFNWFY
jgi:hypothetical protein